MTTRTYGWRPQLADHRDFLLAPLLLLAASFPASVDLRPGAAPVYDQGQEGSCTMHAAGGIFDYDRGLQGLDRFMPSRQAGYYWEREKDGTLKQGDAGSQLRTAAWVLANKGLAHEELWPYSTPLSKKPTAAVLADAAKHKASVYQAVTQDQAHFKSVLSGAAFADGKGRPIMFGFTVYESFESADVAKTGIVPIPHRGEKILGGHAVAIFGYDDAKQAYLVRNSWGTSWGEGGYCWMPYSYVEGKLASDFWVVQTLAG